MQKIPHHHIICLSAACALFFSCGNKTPEQLFQEAHALTMQEEYAESIELLNEIISEKADFDSAYTERAFCYLNLGEYDLALEDAEKGLSMNKNNMKARYVRGLVNLDSFDIHTAITDFTTIIVHKDTMWYESALFRRAKAYYIINELEKSLIDLDEFIMLNPVDPDAYVMRGIVKSSVNVYRQYGDTLKAVSSDTTLNRIFHDRFIVQYVTREDLTTQDLIYDTKGAFADFDAALKIDPQFSGAWYQRSLLFIGLKRWGAALYNINQAIQFDQENDVLYSERSWIYQNLGESQKALEDLDMAISINPDDPFHYENRAWLKENSFNDYEGAEEDKAEARYLHSQID